MNATLEATTPEAPSTPCNTCGSPTQGETCAWCANRQEQDTLMADLRKLPKQPRKAKLPPNSETDRAKKRKKVQAKKAKAKLAAKAKADEAKAAKAARVAARKAERDAARATVQVQPKPEPAPEQPQPQPTVVQPPTPKPAAPRKIGCLTAAAMILQQTGKTLNCDQLITEMANAGLWSSPGGLTPAATLSAAIYREMKGTTSRFRRGDGGKGFAFNTPPATAPVAPPAPEATPAA